MRTALLSLLLAACNGGTPGPTEPVLETDTDTDTDADSDTDTDTDSDTDTDTDTDTDPEDGTGSIADSGTLDYWRVSGAATPLTISVDTVNAATAFDAAAFVARPDTFPAAGEEIPFTSYELLASPDDDFDCTFPPPMFQCPSATVTSTDDVMLAVIVATPNASGPYDYRVDAVDGDGNPLDVTFLRNQ